MPLFEAVQNSIHAIEDSESPANGGKIVVDILRDSQHSLLQNESTTKRGPESHPNIIGFKITDDGIGFNDLNMESFETLDSDLKASIGGRGVGRLLWLKAFDSASVDSVYIDSDGRSRQRRFSFTARNGVTKKRSTGGVNDSKPFTTVLLEGFDPRYRDASRKTLESIADQLFEHCLWYFVRDGGAPTIIVRDNGESLNLDKVYEAHMHSSAQKESIEIKGHPFELTHIKLRVSSSQTHMIGWCATNRLVKEENISSKIPGLHRGRLGDAEDQFIYACYVASQYLDERVRPERTGFVLEKKDAHGLFSNSEASETELTEAVLQRAQDYLSPYLERNRQAAKSRITGFVAEKQPRYRPILDRIPEDELYVDPNISDKELDVFLHKHRATVESKLISEGHRIMQPAPDDKLEDYEERIRDYLRLADDIKKSDLAEYVSHRKVILDLLRMAISQSEDGKYSKEDLIHELIMPMRKESNSTEFERSNLWLINERLAFHDFLASDKPLSSMPITECADRKEPDILALNVYNEPILLSEGKQLPLASIVIVELKRPMRNDARSGEDHDPIEQSLGYLKRIRAGGVLTAAGRPIPDSPDIPGFCYIVCDLTNTMIDRCDIHGLTVTSDHMGYFGYNSALKAYIEVISFDQLLKAGTERNRAFFEKLGFPNN